MKLYRHSLHIILLLLFPLITSAQLKEIKKAEKALARNNYVRAIKFYKKSYEKQGKKETAFLIGQAYSAMNQTEEAIPWYRTAIASGSDSAKYFTALGKAVAKNEKFENALQLFRQALDLEPSNMEAESGIKAVQLAMETRSMESPISIARTANINSAFSEYSPAWLGKDLVFASTRLVEEKGRIDGRTGQGYSDLYISTFDQEKNTWSAPHKMQSPLNSRFNDGSFAYDENRGLAYTMRCNEKAARCVIIAAEYNRETKTWGETQQIDLDLEDYSLGHPALSADGNTLYFVSDMSGGQGGKDIWKSIRKNDDTWGLPINLGEEVNSEADDLFPFLLGDSILFFASERDFGYGELDIYYSLKEDNSFKKAVNIGHPFNSTSDDFGMIIRKDLAGGFFTSNRISSKSDDIYSFNSFPLLIKVEGLITDQATDEPVEDARVKFSVSGNDKEVSTNRDGKYSYYGILPFKDYKVTAAEQNYYPEIRTVLVNPQGNDVFRKVKQLDFKLKRKSYPVAIRGKVLDRSNLQPMEGIRVEIKSRDDYSSVTSTNEEGLYAFEDLKPETTYAVKVSKEGYFSESRSLDVPAVNEPTVFSKQTGYDMDFLLTKIEKKKEIVLNNIYYDFDKATLRPESKTELNKLASMLHETPNVDIQINAHTDARGWDSYNQGLSERRAQSVVDYLIASGISADRLKARGYGEKKPIVKNAKTEDEHQKNRRTSFKVINIGEETADKIQADEEKLQTETGLEFRIQLMSTSQPIPGFRLFNDILDSIPNTHVFVERENGMYKYQIGTRNTLETAVELKNKIQAMGYEDAFLNAYYNQDKISIDQAKELQKAKGIN